MVCQRIFLCILVCLSFTTGERRNQLASGPSSGTVEAYYGQYYDRDPDYGSYYDRQNANKANPPLNNRKGTVDPTLVNNLQANRNDQYQGNNVQNNLQVRPLNRAPAVAPLNAEDDFGRYDEFGQKIGVQGPVPNTQQRINSQQQSNPINQKQRPGQDDRVTFKDVAPEKVNIGQTPPPGGPVKVPQSTDQRNKFESVLPLQPQLQPRPQSQPQEQFVPSKISLTITNFGLNLLKNIDKSGNTAISPYSIATTLALLQQGARGDTQYQISMALGMLPDESAAAYKKTIDTVKKRPSKNILKVATSIFTNALSFNLNPVFGRIAADNFACDVVPSTFNNPVLSATIINKWVADQTRNYIKDIVTPDVITPDSQLVLANAIFFKGLWKTFFDPKMTVSTDFRLSNGVAKPALFMRLIANFRGGYDKKLGAQVITLPFEGEQYSLMLILPSEEGNLNTVVRNLDESTLLQFLELPVKEVKLMLPRFKISSDTDLRRVLQKMGMTKLFDQSSDLSGVEDSGYLSPKLSSAVHKAVLSIDEKGGTAAASTAFVAVALSSDDDAIYFKADRPFMSILWDSQQQIPLFMAKIEDPSLSN